MWYEWVLVIVFGALFGAAELTPRYRDAPLRALRTRSALLYMFVNAGASAAGLALIKMFGWTFGLTEDQPVEVMRVLVAGFSAMVLFRSSLYVAKIGQEDVAIGPMTVLQTALEAADRGVDRQRAEDRVQEVRAAMAHVSLERAVTDLPALALNLMQNVSPLEKAALAEAADEIAESDLDERTKIYVLGLALMRLTGDGVLRAAGDLLPERATS